MIKPNEIAINRNFKSVLAIFYLLRPTYSAHQTAYVREKRKRINNRKVGSSLKQRNANRATGWEFRGRAILDSALVKSKSVVRARYPRHSHGRIERERKRRGEG